jgi:hypothetical protein
MKCQQALPDVGIYLTKLHGLASQKTVTLLQIVALDRSATGSGLYVYRAE